MLWIHISDSKRLGGLQSTSEMGLICNEGDEGAIPLTQHNSEGVWWSLCRAAVHSHHMWYPCYVKLSQVWVSCAAFWPVHASPFPFILKFKARLFQHSFLMPRQFWHASPPNSPVILQSGVLCSCPNVHLELVFKKLPLQFQCWLTCHLLLWHPLLRPKCRAKSLWGSGFALEVMH